MYTVATNNFSTRNPISDILPMDIAAYRKDTPTCETLIHFNNAGASLMPDPVYEAIAGHLELERAIGGYEAEAKAQASLERFYTSFAKMLRVEPQEIAYIENATRAWDMAFYSLPLKEGDRVLTHASEYVSNYLAFLQLAERKGVEIDLVPSDASGQIDLEAIPKLITSRTKLIALTHIPTFGGLVNPAEEVGTIAKEYGLWYLLDACQSVGQMDLDVQKIGCHMLTGAGRKFLRGPRGTGFLYCSNAIVDQLDPPFIDLRSATWTGPSSYEFEEGAKRFENWESYVAGKLGLAKAVDYALEVGLENIERRVVGLAALLREKLEAVDGVTVHDQGRRRSGITTFRKEGISSVDLAGELRKEKINVSTLAKTSAQIDFGERGLMDLVRASVHYFNSEDEVTRFCEVLARG